MGSKQIVLVHGDITRYPVDAIVNAANEDLDHIGGVAKAIADAGNVFVICMPRRARLARSREYTLCFKKTFTPRTFMITL